MHLPKNIFYFSTLTLLFFFIVKWLGLGWGPPPSPTFNAEGELWQKNAFSKNVKVDSDNNNLGEFSIIKEKVINNP